MSGGHTPGEKKGSAPSGSCCTWSPKSTIPTLLSQGCSVLINDSSHVNVLLPFSSLTSIHTELIHKVFYFTMFECFLETLFVLFCLQDIWLIYRDSVENCIDYSTEYCVSCTLCFSFCLCRGLILDSLYHVLSALQKSSWDPQEEKYAFLPVFLAKQRYLSRHWLGKFRQGIMCKQANDSVEGKKQTNTRCLKCFNHKQSGENI